MKKIRIRHIGKYPVFDPVSKTFVEAEKTVTDSPYWRRRRRDGDVEFVEEGSLGKRSYPKKKDNSVEKMDKVIK